MAYYSANGVDRTLLLEIFPDYGIIEGMAVECGAFNGLHGSNTLCLEERGWTVLCIEANPLLAEEGKSRRKLWRSVACGAKDADEADFWYYQTVPSAPFPFYHYASESALVKDGKVPYRTDAPPPEQQIKVPVRTMDRLLEEAGFHWLDFASIDVEGGEEDVLAGFDLERWKPVALSIESWSHSIQAPPNYRQVGVFDYDHLFVRDKDKLHLRRAKK